MAMMKKLLAFMALSTMFVAGKAQAVSSFPYEPEVIGETNLLSIAGTDTVAAPLEKSWAR